MQRAVVRTSLALVAMLSVASIAGAEEAKKGSALDFWIGDGDTSDSRKDVDQVTRPLPPSGPATPVPYCGPSALECP